MLMLTAVQEMNLFKGSSHGNDMGKEALVVRRDVLFREKYFEGFLPAEEYDFLSLIAKNHTYYPRGDELEHNAMLQQIIPYVLIVHPETKRVFAYRRTGSEKYQEKRLRNKWSCGVGGHIERCDDAEPVQSAMMRELREEVVMKNYPQPRIVGYVNDDVGDVEKVHFGIVALAESEEEDIAMGDGEIAEGKFMSVAEIEELFVRNDVEVESWALLVLPYVKQYLLSL